MDSVQFNKQRTHKEHMNWKLGKQEILILNLCSINQKLENIIRIIL